MAFADHRTVLNAAIAHREAESGERDVLEFRTVGGDRRSACGKHRSAECDAFQVRTGIAYPSVRMPERSIDDDFLQSCHILECKIRQELHTVDADATQSAAFSETILPQFHHMLRKLHLYETVAAVECPFHDDGLLRDTDAAQGGTFKGPNADGVHTFGQYHLFQPAVPEGKGRKGQSPPLHLMPFILVYVGFTARDEGGAAEVESLQTAFGGLLVAVATRHFAQEAEVGAVQRPFDGDVRQCVFPVIAYQCGESAGSLHLEV